MRDVLESVGAAGRVLIQPVHGDLHVGQVLEWTGGLAVIDFDGNPTLVAKPPTRSASRASATSPRCSRASTTSAGSSRSVGGGDRSAWIAEARAGFLASIGPVDDALLAAFEVEQECRELVYADRFLPRWRYAPMATLRARFGAAV